MTRWLDLYEPIDVPTPIGDGLWVVDGPLVRMTFAPAMRVPFPTRMVIARLRGGELWVWSPTELTNELRARVDALGTVRHLISPSRLHYTHIATWQRAYEGSIAWASPGVRERAASHGNEVHFDRDLGDVAESDWEGEIDQLIFRGSRTIEEVVFFHRSSRTLVLADLIENFERKKLGLTWRLMATLGGVLDPDGKAPIDFRATFAGHKDVARACLQRMQAWQPERIVMAHGRWYDKDGGEELARAFRWLR